MRWRAKPERQAGSSTNTSNATARNSAIDEVDVAENIRAAVMMDGMERESGRKATLEKTLEDIAFGATDAVETISALTPSGVEQEMIRESIKNREIVAVGPADQAAAQAPLRPAALFQR